MDTREITGACRCGAVTYRFTGGYPLAGYCCHCRHCQRWSGSAFAEQVVVPDASFVCEGTTTTYVVTRSPGEGDSTHHFCPRCHSQLYAVNTGREGIVLVRAGTLDDPAPLSPAVHIWVTRKRPWVVLPEGVPTFPESPDPAAFLAIMAPLLS